MVSKSAKASGGSHKRRLGRGLGSLMSAPVKVEVGGRAEIPEEKKVSGGVELKPEVGDSGLSVMVEVGLIRANPKQPRQDFDQESLLLLAQSIERDGMMQPIVVRPVVFEEKSGEKSGKVKGVGGKMVIAGEKRGYEIVAGERRWRAALMVEMREIPALVRELDDATAAQWSLVENLQREDLNPMERAEAFGRLQEEYGLTHLEISERIGMSRANVTNHLRLLELDGGLREALRGGGLTVGHGKVLLGITNLDERRRLAAKVIAKGLSVRELEGWARRFEKAGPRNRGAGDGEGVGFGDGDSGGGGAHLASLQKQLGEHLGTRVKVVPGRRSGSGKVVIEFYDLDQFDGLLRRFGFEGEF